MLAISSMQDAVVELEWSVKYPDSSFTLHGWIIMRTVSAAQENWHIRNYFKNATLQSQHNDIEIVLYFMQRYFCRGKYLSGNVGM